MRKGQSFTEYTILVIIVAAAFITLQTYMKRGFQGRWKDAADQVGEQYDTAAFDSNVRYTINSETMSRVTVVNAASATGVPGLITYREDTASTIEKKTGEAHIEKAP